MDEIDAGATKTVLETFDAVSGSFGDGAAKGGRRGVVETATAALGVAQLDHANGRNLEFAGIGYQHGNHVVFAVGSL